MGTLFPCLAVVLLAGCTSQPADHSRPAPGTSTSPATPSAQALARRCTDEVPVLKGPAVVAQMHKSGRGGMYPYLRLSRGQQVEAALPAVAGDVKVRVVGDAGVLQSLGQRRSAGGGLLLRYVVVDSGSASIQATSGSSASTATYVAGVLAAC